MYTGETFRSTPNNKVSVVRACVRIFYQMHFLGIFFSGPPPCQVCFCHDGGQMNFIEKSFRLLFLLNSNLSSFSHAGLLQQFTYKLHQPDVFVHPFFPISLAVWIAVVGLGSWLLLYNINKRICSSPRTYKTY